MPEGPSIIILKEATIRFKGRKIIAAEGTTKKIDTPELVGETITDIKTWGKHFLICLPKFTIRIHLLMFGTYRINEQKEAKPRLRLIFSNNEELSFYACAIVKIDEPLGEVYDWSSDVMNKKFDTRKAHKKLKTHPQTLVCDAILDQHIFSGAGNIFKNEVLFRTRIHPLSEIGSLTDAKRREVVKEVVRYGKDFLKWKKAFVLKKHWEVIGKKKCPRDGHKVIKAYLGKTRRRTFYCESCQKLYK